MPKTETQMAADEKLAEAIEECRKAYDQYDAPTGEWILLYEEQMLLEDGEIRNSYGMLMKDGTMATSRAVGLLEVASFDMKTGPRRE